MSKKLFLLVLGVWSILLVTMAVSHPFTSKSVFGIEGSDYYERHPDWTISVPHAAVDVIEFSDYFQRHPELSLPMPLINTTDLSDYFMRHPELHAPATVDLTDYFQRH